MKCSLRAAVIAVAAIFAIVGGFQFLVSSVLQDDSSIVAAATIDDQGEYTITNKAKYYLSDDTTSTGRKTQYASIEFEVSGRVQGVSFRRHTKAKAEELGLMGWCRNMPHGTVNGEYEYTMEDKSSSSSNEKEEEGHHRGAAAFRHWLCNVGSPRSSIDECVFSQKAVSDSRSFNDFRVIR